MALDVAYIISLQDKFSGKLGAINKSTKSFDKTLGRTIGRFASFAAAGAVIGDSIKKIALFEEQVSNLSAITGAVGEDLDFLANKAIELGGATTKSSIDTVQAFKLIASAKPELLTNAAALASVTEEAIALSEASGLELPQAASSLTDALNQFGLAADQSSRVINVLAAGSKFAAAEIPDLTMSLKEFGGVADSLNISLEESAAAVETLSSKGLKGARAGINLRNVFLKLGAGVDKYNPKVVGLSTALENLSEIQDDTTELTKMFGRQNVLAAQTLIKQRDTLDDLTESMTGTNIAYEQQAINTDNLISDYKKLGSSWEKLVLNLNQGSGSISKALRGVVQTATNLLDVLDKINQGESLRLQRFKKQSDLQGRIAKIEAAIPDKIKLKAEREKTTEEEARRQLIETAKVRLATAQQAFDVNKKTIDSIDSKLFSSRKDQVKAAKAHGKEMQLAMNLDIAKATLKSLEKFNITAPEVVEEVEPEVSGLDKVEDQVTKITSAAPKTFNINIAKFVENFSVNSETITEGANEVKDTFTDMWIKMIADVQAVGG